MVKKQFTNPEKFFQKFGARIRQVRQERDLTQEDMFDLGFSYRFFQRIEAGKPIHLKTALRLADAFRVSIEYLFKNL